MTSPSGSPSAEQISRTLKEAEDLMNQYWELDSQAQEILKQAMAKFAEAKAMMPLPLFAHHDREGR